MQVIDLCRIELLYEEAAKKINSRFFHPLSLRHGQVDTVYEVVHEETLKQVRESK